MAAMAFSSATAMKLHYRPYEGTNPWHKGPKFPEFVDPTDHPVNYGVPNFGEDSDIKSSFKNTADAEETLKHTMHASFDAPAAPPRDYFVPHFGEDDDIKSTK